MEEFRIDCLHQTAEELEKAKELRQNIFRLNHTMPDTEAYHELLHKIFPNIGENCRIEIPFSGVRTANVKFGRNIIIMSGCLMMSAGTFRLSAWEMEEFDKEYAKIDLMGHRTDPFTES